MTNTGVFPFNTICYLEMYQGDSGYRGSGSIVSPYTVLTCGHVVYNQDNNTWMSSITVAPGQKEYTSGGDVYQPYGVQSAAYSRAPQPYVEGGSWEYDYAALHLKQPFYGIATYIPIEFDCEIVQGDTFNVIGYPGEAQGSSTFGLWLGGGPVDSVDSKGVLWHTIDATSGNSGGPTYYYLSDSGARRIVATLAGGGDKWNVGPYFNARNKSLIVKWLEYTPGATATGSGGRDETPTITVRKGESFDHAVKPDAAAEIMLSRTARPEDADIRLLCARGRDRGRSRQSLQAQIHPGEQRRDGADL